MSKILKSSDISTDSNRQITPLIKTKRTGTLLNPAQSSSKLMIGRQESPYSKLQSISKTRSSSNLKKNSEIKLKQISPNRYSALSSVLNSSESKRSIQTKKPSKNSSLSKSFNENKEILTEKTSDYQKDANLIEIKLNEKLKNFKGKKEIWNVYKEIFIDVIKKDKIFSAILEKIFEFYEEYIKELVDLAKIEGLEEKVKNLEMNLKAQLEINKGFEKKYEKLAKENYDIAKELDRSEEVCTEIQKRLFSIAEFDIETVPKDEVRWKALIMENKKFHNGIKDLTEEVKSMKYKEKKLLQLIMEIKKKGYPVEDIYKEFIIREKRNKFESFSSISSNSDGENLVSERQNQWKKPENIPNLNMLLLEPESISSSFESLSSNYSHY